MQNQKSKIKNQNFRSKFKTFNFLLVFLTFAFLLLPLPAALAQSPQKGLTVYPSIFHLDLAVDPPEYNLTYVNNTSGEINLKLSVQDFTQLEDSYKISFLEGKDAQNYKYSLSSWISFENKQINLNPGEKKSVKVFIDKDRITKGGHYASILAEIIQPDNKQQVNVKAILSSLLFVRASTGKEIEDGSVRTFKALQDTIEYPESYSLRFNNSGNVHVIPYGTLEVLDPLGNLVAKAPINENSLDALPESIRNYEIKVNTYQKYLVPGFYTAKLSLHFGKTNQKLSATTSFFSQGIFDFAKIGIIIAVIIMLLIVYKRKRKISNSAM